jgi:hypothetical protein
MRYVNLFALALGACAAPAPASYAPPPFQPLNVEDWKRAHPDEDARDAREAHDLAACMSASAPDHQEACARLRASNPPPSVSLPPTAAGQAEHDRMLEDKTMEDVETQRLPVRP